MRESGGASGRSLAMKVETEADEPCTSMSTPAESFSTCPTSPHSCAKRYIKGRKPTPCTTPVICMRRRTTAFWDWEDMLAHGDADRFLAAGFQPRHPAIEALPASTGYFN